MAGFIAGHLVHGVMYGVKIERLGLFSKLGLAESSAIFSRYAHFKVFPGAVRDYFAKKLGKLGSMLGFFICSLFPIKTDLGIAFTMGDPGHGKIHADFGTFAVKVGAQTFNYFRINALGYADNMLGSPIKLVFLNGNKL